MKKAALVIMAAGLGARFGGGIKQLEPLGPEGECLLMYSVHDAVQAGFDQIIFIIRKEIEAEFRQLAGDRVEKACAPLGVAVGYAYQSTQDLPEGFLPFEEREKPWGTGQAVLCAVGLLHGPFAVINADDYYGKESFQKLYAFLTGQAAWKPYEIGMVGFRLGNTLSENGGVTRGICQVTPDGYLSGLCETEGIVFKGGMVFANGIPMDQGTCVSMNMWGFPMGFLRLLKEGFEHFLGTEAQERPLAAEYLLPTCIGRMLRQGWVTARVLETSERWFGITYQEDKMSVRQALRRMQEQGDYPAGLFSDLLPGMAQMV